MSFRLILAREWLAASAFIALAAPVAALTVTNTNDTGNGSLRQAITDANATAALDTITFDIPGAGVHTINLLSALPTVTAPVFLAGTTQPGYTFT
ncbi:MAG: hypothetical protein ABR589_11705, partial [Chthoniobacterales bacterium]